MDCETEYIEDIRWIEKERREMRAVTAGMIGGKLREHIFYDKVLQYRIKGIWKDVPTIKSSKSIVSKSYES